MKTMIRRITACAMAGMLALSAIVTPAMAASEQNVLAPGKEGFVSLDQYIAPTSVPGVYEVTLAVGAKLDPKPMDIIIVLDESASMFNALPGGSGQSRWDGAKEGANLAIDTFFDPEINPGYDMTRVATFAFGTGAPADSYTSGNVPSVAADGFATYKLQNNLKSEINSWGLTMTQSTEMDAAMDLTQKLFANARRDHKLENYPEKSYGTNSSGSLMDYENKVQRYVIFLSDGTDRSTGPRAMIDYATELKLPPKSGTDQFGVKFYTIGLGLGSDPTSQNSEAPAAGSGVYKDWNKRENINPLNPNQPFTDVLIDGLWLSTGNQANDWVFDQVDLTNTGTSSTIPNGQDRSKLFNGYFDIPGDQYPNFGGFRAASLSADLYTPQMNDPAQTLIYTAMGIDPTKGNAAPYSAGAISAAPGSFGATPFGANGAGYGPTSGAVAINSADSVIKKAADAAAAGNPVGQGLAELGVTDVNPNSVLAYYNRDTWDGRTPEFYMADTSSELSNAFETIARKIVQFGRDIKTTATLNTDQFELYTGFSDAPKGVKVNGAKQNVSVSGNQVSWTMDAIPRTGVNRVTMYVKVKPGSYADGISYSVLKDLNISYIDDQNFYVNGVSVDTAVTKNFPAVYVNPSESTIENNGYGLGSGGSSADIIQNSDSQGQIMTNNGPSVSGGQAQGSTSLGTPTGSVMFAGVGVNIPTYTSSTKRATISKDGAKMYQKTTSGKYKAVATLKKGNSFSILSEDGDYYKVLYMKKGAKKASVGYVLKKDAAQAKTKATATTSPSPSPTATASPSTK